MRFTRAYIPYGLSWSTPFAKWQGSLSHLHSVRLAGETARKVLAARGLDPAGIGTIVLGTTVPQRHLLYGTPWVAAMLGAEGSSGPMVSQACATGARSLAVAGAELECDPDRTVLTITADRCSNGPHLYYPNPQGPGGTGEKEDWVLDSFGFDPWARNSMTQTAENVAAETGISREEQDACTLVRYRQYQDALADGAAFQKRYMLLPFEVPDASGRKVVGTLQGDEGVFATSEEGLRKLRPVQEGGTVTFGSQTHPADGHCGMVLAGRERARELSKDPAVEVQLLSYGQARVKKGFMAMATVPAARAALAAAGVSLDEVAAAKTHNPFAVNDIYFARETGWPVERFNNYGSSLVYGHPQAPTGMRLTIELVEELVLRGGGIGLFVGCAAGDTAAAVVLRVGR